MQPQPPAAPQGRTPFVRWVAIALLILSMPIFVLGATIAATGTVTVDVEASGPDGVDLYLPVPALLFDLAVLAAPLVVPDDALAAARREIGPYRDALSTLADELEDCPQGVLVHVKTPREEVLVSKSWRSFRVQVHSPEADIEVSVPARLVGRALDVL